MAEQIPFNIIADVLTKLGSLAIQEIGSAFGVAKQLTALKPKLDTINGVLVDAEEKQVESHAVQAWLRRLKDVVYDADDLLDDFATHQLQRGGVAREVSDFFSSSNQVVFRFKMSNKVKHITKEVDDIEKQIPPMLNVIQGNIVHRGAESSWRETHSFVLTSEIVERDEDKEKIIHLLMSSANENLSAVAIIGIGGLGKTTLAQLVYNDKRVVEFFEPKIWICVSDDFDVKLLVKKILESISGGVAGNLESLEVLKVSLHEKLREKRYLLVLDDVWNDDFQKWDKLRTLLMVGAKGSKILVTTRNSDVASTMGIDHFPFSLKGLKENQSWNLFSKIAFEEGQERLYPSLVEIGKEIVNMCNGVPLVIKTLATILASKTEEREWLSIKNNEKLFPLGDRNDNVLSVLKLSYDHLPIYLKQCFAYCALFPKNHEIEKNMLVQLWMAQGYIQPLDETVGDRYFDELLSRSLLEKSEYNMLCYKMHDLIHDLAQSVIGSEVLVLKDDVEKISKEVHHVSLFDLLNIKLEALKAKHIRTFLSIPIRYKYEDASIQSFSSFKCLRVLSLNSFNVKKLPESLGKLSHLRFLDLSSNQFEVLPNSITRLKNLQTLRLVGCYKLKKFPKDLKELINLRHWENDKDLSHMPRGIGELTWLQSLPVFVVRNGRGVGRLSELKGLNNLRGELSIVNLENARDVVVESREANLGEKQHIQSLRLIWPPSGAQSGEDAESVLEGLQPHLNLKQLSVEGYGGGRFPSWMMNGGLSSMLPNLITINLECCSRCQTLPCFARLPYLKSLELLDLRKVEKMECSSKGPVFPSLEYLKLKRMPKLKELWRDPPPSFPCLSELRIMGCDKLASLLVPPSPLFSQLDIEYCDELASLELHSSPLLSSLKIFHCPKLTSLLLPPSPLLSQLMIENCDELASLELHSSPLLSSLNIFHCPKLTSLLLPPSPLLSSLKLFNCYKLTSLLLPPSPLLSQLMIENCDELASLELHSSPLLSKLEISICPKLTSLQLPPSPLLSRLCISHCSKLTSLLLPPSPLLSQLMIENCDELASLELHSSPLLSHLDISSCDELASLELHSSPSLSSLYIWNCPKLTSLQLPPSPLLSRLCISHCSKLTSLLLPPSPLLSQLMIENCDELASLELHSSPLLSHLDISSCDELASLELHSSPSLSSLYIWNCPKLTSLQLPPSPLLSRLCISYCSKLTSLLLPPSPLLSQLMIENCDELASLELHSSPLLSKLEISFCLKLTSLLLPPSPLLSQLMIRKCDELASLKLHLSPPLSSLYISHCPKLTSLQVSSLPCLKTLEPHIVREEVLRQLMLATASSLESVSITSIDDLMSLPDELYQHVSTLQTLKIWDCSRLTTLSHWIGNLTSLTDLEIGSCPQLTSFPEELRSLRILKSLTIQWWSGLTTLPDWIGSLSSLECLRIHSCPQLTSLTEEMRSLTTLQRLEIFHCPHLSERCQRENCEDWPKIAHVPDISIY